MDDPFGRYADRHYKGYRLEYSHTKKGWRIYSGDTGLPLAAPWFSSVLGATCHIDNLEGGKP